MSTPTVMVTLRLAPEVKNQLDVLAAIAGISVNRYILEAAEKRLESDRDLYGDILVAVQERRAQQPA